MKSGILTKKIFRWDFQRKNPVFEIMKIAVWWAGGFQKGTFILRINTPTVFKNGSFFFVDQFNMHQRCEYC